MISCAKIHQVIVGASKGERALSIPARSRWNSNHRDGHAAVRAIAVDDKQWYRVRKVLLASQVGRMIESI